MRKVDARQRPRARRGASPALPCPAPASPHLWVQHLQPSDGVRRGIQEAHGPQQTQLQVHSEDVHFVHVEGLRDAAGSGGSLGERKRGAEGSASDTGEARELVEVSGLEPLTFWLPARRSPN